MMFPDLETAIAEISMSWPPQKLLVVLVMKVFEDKQTTDVIDEGVFLRWVVVNSILIFAIIAD